MTTAALFGISLASLFAAIAQVESESGKTSRNVYQLTRRYVDDVNRISTPEAFLYEDRLDRAKAERMMCIYLEYYGRRHQIQTGMQTTAEVLARIHNGGPDGWRRPSTLNYWKKVKAAMDAAKGAEQ